VFCLNIASAKKQNQKGQMVKNKKQIPYQGQKLF
jgi:hypothetical protein